MIRPIGDRFVYKGYTLEVFSEQSCDGCFFDGGDSIDDCTRDNDAFDVCGCCSMRNGPFSKGVVFKVVGMNGDLAIGHEFLFYTKKLRVEKAIVETDGIDLCEGCALCLLDCSRIREELKLGRCNQTRYDKTGVIFKFVEEGGEE